MAALRDGDRLSALPAEALARILTLLPSDEAARASTLSRRWRGVSDAVPVVDLVDGKITHRRGINYPLPLCFDQQVTSAVLSKDEPIRVFRLLALQPPQDMLDQWILIAATSGAEEVDVELRYRGSSRRTLCPFGRSQWASADFGDDVRGSYTSTPRQLFRCHTLRRLRLVNWTLDLPSPCCGVLFAASLETLCLKRIMAREAAVIQELVAGCPCLVDLTLEECPGVTEITVESPRLRSFAMVCCHNATRVLLHNEHLRSLHYKGCRPYDLQFLDVPNYDEVASLTIDICDDLTGKGSHEVAPVMELVTRCKNLTYLHLALRPSMTCYSSEFIAIFSGLPKLRQLVLKSSMATEDSIKSVALLIVNTQQLEALRLFPRGPKRPKKKLDDSDDDSDSNADDSDADNSENCFINSGNDDCDDDGHNYNNGDEHDYNIHNRRNRSNRNGSLKKRIKQNKYRNCNGHDYNTSNSNGHDYKNSNGHDYDDDGDYHDEDYDDDHNYYDVGNDNSNDDNYDDGHDYEMFRTMWHMGMPCFSHSLKRVNIAKYRGTGLNRILANFLLSKGRALEEFSVTLSAQLSPHKEEITMEFRSWLCNPSATVTCK